MSAEKINPRVDYRRLAALAEEFKTLWTRLQGFYLDATVGFGVIRKSVERGQERARARVRGTDMDTQDSQDSRMLCYDSILQNEFCTSAIHKATQGEARARNSTNGANYSLLGQLCLVSFYDYWNERLRREYVIAKGLLQRDADKDTADAVMREHASFDLWGDIRQLRQSVVHNGGVATRDVDRCTVLKWFEPGESICLTPRHVRALFLELLLFHNQLFAEQFPKSYMRLPKNAGDGTGSCGVGEGLGSQE